MSSSTINPHNSLYSITFNAPAIPPSGDIIFYESDDEEDMDISSCLICMSGIASPVTTDCGCNTEYHAACIGTWLESNKTCPTCRKNTRVLSNIDAEPKYITDFGFPTFSSGTGFRNPAPSFSIQGRQDTNITFTIGISRTPTSVTATIIDVPIHATATTIDTPTRSTLPSRSCIRKKTKKCHYCRAKFASLRGVCNHLMRQHPEEYEASNYGRYIYAKTPQGHRRQFYGFECTSKTPEGGICGHIELREHKTLEECEFSMHAHWQSNHCTEEESVPVDYIL